MASGFGAFGKIPSMGDFLRLNMSARFVQAWDTWLQQGMLTAREVLGARWNDAYMSAPIWRFTLPAGLAGDQAMSGILMASVDRVGRQYPLTLVAPHVASSAPLVHFANRTVFEQLENIALSALDDNFDRDVLTSALAQIQLVTPAEQSFAGVPYTGPLPAAQVMAADVIAQQHGQVALWSAMMDNDHRLTVTRALPEGRDICGLFDLGASMWGQTGMAQTA